MKKVWILCTVLAVMFLSGCKEPVYETVADEPAVAVIAPCRQMVVNLPDGAVTTAGQTGEELYECDGFTVVLQTLEAGDLNRTLQTVTGYGEDQLQLIQWTKDDVKRYDSVFTAAGEDSLQVGRTCILDDGAYHYALTTLAPEDLSGQLQEQWNELFSTFRLVDSQTDLSTGS